MHNRDGAQIEQLGRDGGLLRGDDDARAQVTLQADGGQEGLGEGLALGTVGHVFVRLIEGDDAARLGVLLEEEAQADVE